MPRFSTRDYTVEGQSLTIGAISLETMRLTFYTKRAGRVAIKRIEEGGWASQEALEALTRQLEESSLPESGAEVGLGDPDELDTLVEEGTKHVM